MRPYGYYEADYLERCEGCGELTSPAQLTALRLDDAPTLVCAECLATLVDVSPAFTVVVGG